MRPEIYVNEDIIELRGKIITDMIEIERQIDHLITEYFFDGPNYEFMKNILNQNRMSTFNKINAFSDLYDVKSLRKKLLKLNEIRNDFAHYTLAHYLIGPHIEEPLVPLVAFDKFASDNYVKKSTITELEKKFYNTLAEVHFELFQIQHP